jgi:hypothetical protein
MYAYGIASTLAYKNSIDYDKLHLGSYYVSQLMFSLFVILNCRFFSVPRNKSGKVDDQMASFADNNTLLIGDRSHMSLLMEDTDEAGIGETKQQD